MQCDRLWVNARLATMAGPARGQAKLGQAELGLVERGVLGVADGRIAYAGPADGAPRIEAAETIDCGDRWITPGLIDCHTHLVHAGNRADEFELRQQGASYAEIARAGGGIVSTVKATRAASTEELVASALPRLDALIAEGATTVEVKSGYGLDLGTEQRMLLAARRLGELRPVSIVTSFLGAHALPPEYAGNADGYIDHLAAVVLPALAEAGLVDAVDAFCEGIGFTPAQVERLFRAARDLGLPVKLHAEQLSNQHGAALAARFGALSADHLEHLDAAGIAAMAASGTVAVLLPGAFLHMRETQRPPVEALRAAHVPMALATDCNPGTLPLTSLLLAMHLGATLFGLSVGECLMGVTAHAARALGLGAKAGTLQAGARADFAIWSIDRPAELVSNMGFNPLYARVWNGR